MVTYNKELEHIKMHPSIIDSALMTGIRDFTRKLEEKEKQCLAAAFRARLVKDSAPAGEIILNTFIIKSLKDQSNGKQDSSQN